MTSTSSTVLAVGASGKFAGLVIPELGKRGAKVRGLIHDSTKERQVRQLGAAEVVVGDLSDRASMNAALKDVDSVFYIAPAFLPNEAELGISFVEAAAQAGARRIVFSSVIHPVLSALQNHMQKGPVEEAILTSGMEYTFLHPTVFFQNFSQSWPRIVETGVLAEPWSVDSRFSRVDYRDVAEVAAIALTEDRLLYGTFELCAEGHLDRNDVAAIIAGVLGRPIKAERIDEKMAAADAGPGAPALERMFGWYDKRGLLGSALTLRAILGREPRTLRSFFEELQLASIAKSERRLPDYLIEPKDINMANLFSPFDLNGLMLPNRILMSAMTRTRASEDGVPTDLMRDYYVQRASAGLIVTECTQVSDQGHGIIRCPGLHRADQVAGWRRVTDAVHSAGGRIYCQIWHCGRVAHPDMRGGELPVGPSPIPATGDFFLPSGRVDFPVPRTLGTEEIAPIIEAFAQATRNAREAGFDGVELHGANGYLQDQFLQDGSNKRTDAYGGSIENRARLMLETTKAMIGAWSAERVGVRLSPSSYLYGIDDSNKLKTFGYAVRALDALGIGYLCLLEPNAKDVERGVQIEHVVETFRPMTTVSIIVNTGFDKSKGNTVLAQGKADLVAFGVPYLANPDLVERYRHDAPLNKPDPSTFYGLGPKGYIDYPALPQALA